MEEKVCSGDCLKCSVNQRFYCSAQNTYQILENQRVEILNLSSILERLTKIEGYVGSEDVKVPVREGKSKKKSE